VSRYQSSSTRLTATNVALTNYVRTRWEHSAATLCTSGELSALAGQLIAPSANVSQQAPPLHTAARLLADTRLAELAQTAGPAAQAQLWAVRAQLPSGTDLLPGTHTGNLPTASMSSLTLDTAAADLFTHLAQVLAREERSIVADAAVDTLNSRGYTVIHESGAAADGIEARRGNEIMLLAVTDAGEISTDHLGADGACADRQARFEAGMADRGVTMRSRTVDPHEDHVGPLISAAAAAGDTSLALAVARHTVARAGNDPAPTATRATTRTRALQQEETS
jgi:hypothetical protein